MVNLNPNISINTLSAKRLNMWIKIQRLSEWIKNKMTICCVQEMHFKYNDAVRLAIKDGKKYMHPWIKTKLECLY